MRQKNSGFWDKLCILQRPLTFPRSFVTLTAYLVSDKNTVPCILQLLAAYSRHAGGASSGSSHFLCSWTCSSEQLRVLPTSLSTNISYPTQSTALLGLKNNDNFTWLRILKFRLHSCRGNCKWNILFILFPSYTYIFILLGMLLLACFPNV